jgi:hypothetical protein
VIGDRRIEGVGQNTCVQLPLFMGGVRQTFQHVRLLLENGSDNPFGLLLKEGVTDSALIIGDSKKVLLQMPEGVFQTCVTSPPYWSLRNYNIPGQIGLELSLDDYIQNIVAVFDQIHRVLRDDGTLWLNIGDSYTSGGRTWRAPDKKNPIRAMDIRPPTPDGLKSKDLIGVPGVPWRLAFALQEAGWYLRADIIWNKPNCQPQSVKDRPTRCHEYLFLFSKAERYISMTMKLCEVPMIGICERCGISTHSHIQKHTLPLFHLR